MDENNNGVKTEPVFFRTLMDKAVVDELKLYAQSMCTATGKWDYNVAIRDLLFKASIYEKIMELDMRLGILESKPQDEIKKEVKKDELKLLGKRGVEQNDKI